jgi:hypothetical protein
MLRGHLWLRIALVAAVIIFPVSLASAQDDPFGDVAPSGPKSGVAPAVPAATAPAKETAVPEAKLPDAQLPIEDFCRCVGESDSAAVARIEKVLNGPLRSNGIDFTDTPLEEVINLLQDEYGIPIQLDIPALEATGLDPGEKITANLHNISLRSALQLMLKRLQLTYFIQDEVLLITTPEEAEAHLATCVYNVGGFIEDTGDASMEALIDTIVSCVQTATWAENGGGEAEIRPLRPGLLVISQTQDVHDEINSLLKAIRDMRGDEGGNGVAGRGDEEVVTRLYALQVKGDAETLGDQVREMIIQSIPDEQWEGRLPDGQSVTLTILDDRVIVRQKPSVHEKVATLLKDSGVAAPVRPSEINRDRAAGAPRHKDAEKREGDNKNGAYLLPAHEPRVSG